MRLTYRTRRRLRRLWVFTGYLLLIAALVWLSWVVWLGRFVVYDSEGAKLRFDYKSPEGVAEIALPPQTMPVEIYYNEGADFINTSTELTQLRGYYATTSMFIDSVDTVAETIDRLPEGSAVMLDLKSIYGNFYYSSTLADAPVTDQADVAAIDALIEELTGSDLYVIARVPAFRDRAYGLSHTNYGLAHPAGYLWAGEDNCYWLDPTSTGTLTWLISVANELRSLGFDEVVFSDFCFPDTENIVFDSTMTRQQALEKAADTLVATCSTTRFAVSFQTDNPAFVLPQGRCRLYLTDVSASGVAGAAEAAAVADTLVQLVFVTEANDTRYDAYGAMRPMPIPTT